MIEERALDDLDADEVQQSLDEMTTRIQEQNTHVDVTVGVFHDLIIYYQSVIDTRRKASVQDYLNARSLKQIAADPALADNDLVDDVLSNFRVDRKEGAQAVGEVTIVRDNNVSMTMGVGTAFTGNGKRFFTTRVFTAKSESGLINSDTDRLITQLADGNYAFTIFVEAEEDGVDSLLTKDTLVVPDVEPNGYLTSYAASDFVGGINEETNTELIARLQQGIAARTLSNRVNMSAMLREIEEFSRIVATSIIGYGDREMHRDRHWIWPVSGGGRVDWYIRSEPKFRRTGLTKTAVLIEKTSDSKGIWQFTLQREDAPGYYEIDKIRLTGASTSGYEVTEDTRSYDVTELSFTPDVAADYEAAYSVYQTGVIKFYDTDTDTLDIDLGAEQDYDFDAKTVGLLNDLQTTVSSRQVRHFGADCLIKAPVPCFTQVSFTINKSSGQDDPDTDGIRDAVCDVVNSIAFSGELTAGAIYDRVSNFLLPGQTVRSIDMLGRIRYPDGSDHYVRDADILRIPDEPESLVTFRTVQFFSEPDDVGISVMTSVATDT